MIKKIAFFGLVILAMGCKSSKNYAPNSTNLNNRNKKVQAVTAIPKTLDDGTIEMRSDAEVLEATTRVKVTTEMILNYIKTYKNVAQDDMKKFGIPASITLAQAILESGAGTGPLSVKANNHFGIKCHTEWTGASILYNDDSPNECFRKYENPSQSFDDHSQFLSKRDRYAGLFLLEKNDYTAWAKGLKQAGYATDVKYPEKLISIIEKYKLYQYDEAVLGIKTPINPKPTETPKTNNPINNPQETVVNKTFHTVQPKETFYSIAKKYHLTVAQLQQINNITDGKLNIGMTLNVDPSQKSAVQAPSMTPKDTTNTVAPKESIATTTPMEVVKDSIPTVVNPNEVAVHEPVAKTIWYKVQPKDTFYGIAKKHNMSVAQLQQINNITDGKLSIGMSLKVATDIQTAVLPKPENPTAVKPGTALPTNDAKPDVVYYVVQPKDTMYSIAKKFNLTIEKLQEINQITDGKLSVGFKLKVK